MSKVHESYRWSWRPDGTCSYCGSITPELAVRALITRGTRYSGADWKYGWPHKFYLDIPLEGGPCQTEIGISYKGGVETPIIGTKGYDHRKFYNSHLLDANPEVVEDFSELASRLLGVRFMIDDKGLSYSSVGRGWQTWGTVGAEADEDAPPLPQWWVELVS